MTIPISERTKKVLHELGLTEYETRAYLALIEEGVMTASEISARGNVPYSKIYETLNSLEKKGWIETERGRPRRYYPKSPSESLEASKFRLQETVKSWEQAILEELQPLYEKREIREKPDIWILRGEFNILAKLQEMLQKTKHELMVATPMLTKPLLKAALEMLSHLQHSDTRILFLASRDMEKSVLETVDRISEVRVRDHMFGGGVIADSREALLFLGERKPDLVIWSNHIGLVKFAKDYFEYLWKTANDTKR
ncbi:MAG: helix-turn-helix transcriptional regulator [Candidatus Bathyarchaeota archaeon]|nr:helix-turn-helix transcriptional regulator [Candidatus Bathyarchaeota archaeon]MDH5732968.1 helix-turn-helix transcriptional regulator [Candidatus Bathyarchaeota archaeon]